MKLSLLILFPASCKAFLSQRPSLTTQGPLQLSSPVDQFKRQLPDFNFPSVQEVFPNINRLTDNVDQIKANIVTGDLGERGEEYVAVQFGLLLCILVGGLPFISEDFIRLLLGPGMFLSGLITMFLSVLELGPALSPWPIATYQTELATGGPFKFVRHPTYTGLLAFCFGYSVLTESITRLILTGLLYKALEAKVEYEELDLLETFPIDFAVYRQEVQGKIFPNFLDFSLPWEQKGDAEGDEDGLSDGTEF